MTKVRNASRLGTAAAVASAALLVAGCGSSQHASASGPKVSGTAIARAADISGAAKGEKIAYTLSEQLPSLGKLTVTGTGAFNNAPLNQGEMNLTLGVSNASSLGATASAILSNLNLDLILDHQSVYVKLPSSLATLGAAFTHGKPWVSLNLGKLASSSKIPGLSSILSGQTAPTDPSGTLKQLASASSNGVTKVGTSTINGVSTTEYTGTLDLTKLTAKLPARFRARAKARLAQAQRSIGMAKLPFQVYIDSSNLIRRVDFDLTGAKVGGQTISASMQMDFLSYGTQAAPAVPAASDVYDLTSLVGSLHHPMGAGAGSHPFGG